MLRKVNFNPGPAILPVPVLEQLAKSTIEYQNCGMSIWELSHRSKEFEAILANTQALLAKIFGLPEGYQTLFLGGGASLQFSMVPQNFLRGASADYVVTGEWASKAAKEAKRYGKVHVAGDTSADKFNHLPDKLDLDPNAKYVHFTSNNTIYGTQWHDFPATGKVPLFADMSSDILSHRWDASRFSLIYAGAQKNLGPAGVTVVIVKKSLLEQAETDLPTMLAYKTHADNNSLFNTPPCGAIYTVNLVLEWLQNEGGLDAMEKRNQQKAEMLYGVIDRYPEFYQGHVVNKAHRSTMNVTFRLPSEALEEKFAKEGSAVGLHGMKGHRSVGGIRISMYNALPVAGIAQLCDFMETFKKGN